MSPRAKKIEQHSSPEEFRARRLKLIKRRAKVRGIAVDVPIEDNVVEDELPDDVG